MKSSSSTVTCGSLVMIALASLVVLEITSSFTEAYPSYSGYYSPMGYEEPNPYQIPNLQQAIMRLRAAFADNNELENKNNIGLSMVELLELTREAFDLWLKHYQEKLVEADALVEGKPQSPQTKRVQRRSGQFDFGLARGKDAALAAQALIALEKANDPKGAGRRKRPEGDQFEF